MTSSTTSQSFKVADWAVDPALDELSRRGHTKTIEPRMMAVLTYLSSRPGEVVTAEELITEVWHGTIVGDSPVYQCVAKLRRALEDDPHHPSYIETIPKKGYRLIAPVTELADKDSKRPAIAPVAGRFRLAHTSLILLISGSYLFLASSDVARTRVDQSGGIGQFGSIAVLPFVDMSQDQGLEYLGDGIAEELIYTLSLIPDVQVIARTSSFSFKGKNTGLKAIGEKLNVDLVLEGSVRKSGDLLRITAQLVTVDNARPIWSTRFERASGDIFDIQDEIARQVAESFGSTVFVDNERLTHALTDNPEAYDLYLLGKHQMNRRRADSLGRAVEYFEQAILLDAEFAEAYASLSFSYFLASDQRYGKVPDEEAMRKANAAANRAIELDDGLAHAWHALSAAHEYRNPDAAAAYMKRAYELQPNSAEIIVPYTFNLSAKSETGIILAEKAVDLDPLSANTRLNLANRYRWRDRVNEAVEQVRIAIEIDPSWHVPHFRLGIYYHYSGQLDKAVTSFMSAATIEGPQARMASISSWIATNIYLALGDYVAAGRWMEKSRSMGKEAWFVDLQELLILVLRDDPAAHEKLDQWINSIPEEYLCCRETTMLQTVADGYTFGAALEMIMGHNDHATAYLDHALTLPYDQAYEHDLNNWFQRYHLLEWGYLPALNRAHLYRVAGENVKADALMAQCIDYLAEIENDFPKLAGADYVRASLHALQGERDKALASLRKAIGNHWYRAWYAERDPNLASLRDDEEFKQIIEELNANLARMRENVRGAEAG